ncbi:MAG: adenosylcobinamide-GDP ribazoletransferase [Betaproteobacteria bacterium]
MISVRSELEYFFGAIRFFTRLPVPAWVGHSSEALERSTRYFPVVGLIIGSIAAVVFALTSVFWPKTLAVLASMAITLSLTGAFHEDGWSDMVDGFGGGWDKAQILAIMKDSKIGSFGAVALAMMLLTKFFLLVEIDLLLVPFALIAGHAFSRLCATLVLRGLDYVREEGKSKPLTVAISTGGLVFAALTALLPLLLLPPQQVFFAVTLALLATLWLARLFKRHLGGHTGDCLGATQQVSEVLFYGGLLCNFS